MAQPIIEKHAIVQRYELHDELLDLLKAEGVAVVDKPDTVKQHDVLFVIDMQTDFLPGGTFGVAEGDSTIPDIVRLMVDVFPPESLTFVTRDYHPVDHCSFNTFGGGFPPHCVQGSEGSYINAAIGDAVRARGKDNTSVVFKGFSEDIDSFGAVAYSDESADQRLSINHNGLACSSAWTGSFVLKCSNIEKDVNAPPDFTAVLYRKDVIDVVRERKPTPQTSASSGADIRPDAYVCGLAFDFCVLDTALNARKCGAFENVYIVFNATRAAHIPGFGKFGSGFLSDPKLLTEKLRAANVQLIRK
eukprot:GILI01013069.1.p1 GENE.GILI01013069.1~~GILI01013069.1.p1  ORF type:complete len:303 (+),score=42.88 GILI01013069.1:31-939(+)